MNNMATPIVCLSFRCKPATFHFHSFTTTILFAYFYKCWIDVQKCVYTYYI
jgi:hypothetical protein